MNINDYNLTKTDYFQIILFSTIASIGITVLFSQFVG